MYNWPLTTHINLLWAKLVFFKLLLCKFSLMKQPLPKKLISITCTLRGKKDVQIASDDSYMLSEQNWFFLNWFVLVFTNGTNFP